MNLTTQEIAMINEIEDEIRILQDKLLNVNDDILDKINKEKKNKEEMINKYFQNLQLQLTKKI